MMYTNIKIILLCIFIAYSLCQEKGVDPGGQLVTFDSKYRVKDPVSAREILFGQDASSFRGDSRCRQDIDIVWKTHLGSSIYNVPLIADLFSDGSKEIIFLTRSHYVEVLDQHGHKSQGWPFAFPGSTFSSNPLVFDIDDDGTNEIVAVTHDAEIVFLSQDGLPLYNQTLRVPPLKVRKDWFDGLDGEGVVATFALSQYTEKNNGKAPTPNRKLLETVSENEINPADAFQGFEGWLTPEAIESFELFLTSSSSSVNPIKNQQDPLYSPQYERAMDQMMMRKLHGDVFIDAHVLHTPVIADLERDGEYELIVPVSYYFDSAQYSNIEDIAKIDTEVDISKYVAGGIVVFDLKNRSIKWRVDLDLTTSKTSYAGYIYAPPTVVDLQGDGKLEIIVGTGVGYIYIINSNGELARGNFPIMMDALYAQVITEDLNGDGQLEIIACDVNSNVVVFSHTGSELWEARASGYPNQAPSIADIDSDGVLDVVVATNEGHVWAFRGDNGKTLANFPVKLKGRVNSQPLLVPLDDNSKIFKIIVAADDGYVYIIDGATACYDKIDIGESSFSMVLADDINGNGHLDLLVATRSGNVFLLETTANYHPLKSWPSQVLSRNGFTARYGYQGIYVQESSKEMLRDVYGSSFRVAFQIVDERKTKHEPSYYDVKFSSGERIIFEKRYYYPGDYIETLESSQERIAVTIEVEMVNELGQSFVDSFAVSFNVNFYRVLKWVLVVPFAVTFFALLFVKEMKTPLPLSI